MFDPDKYIKPTPNTPGLTPIQRVAGADAEILEGYGITQLNEVIYIPTAFATRLLADQTGRFQHAHPIDPEE